MMWMELVRTLSGISLALKEKKDMARFYKPWPSLFA
jgi:hypothetical protein